MDQFQTSETADRALTEVLKNRTDSDAAAYTALMSDVMAGGNAKVTDEDIASIMHKLEERNILPEIAVGYLKRNFSKLDENQDGELSADELEFHPKKSKFSDLVQEGSGETPDSKLEKQLLEHLRTEPGLFREIATASSAGNSSSAIEIVDLEIYSQERSKQTAFRQNAITLLAGGENSWMARLDEKDGVYDGYASAEDIANYCKKHPSTLAEKLSMLLAANISVALPQASLPEDLADGKHQELLRDGALDIVSLMRKSGLKPKVVNSQTDYVDVEERLQRTQPNHEGWNGNVARMDYGQSPKRR